MNVGHHGAVVVAAGAIGCFGFFGGVICGVFGWQRAGVDLCMVGFVGTVIGGTVAMLHWSEKQ